MVSLFTIVATFSLAVLVFAQPPPQCVTIPAPCNAYLNYTVYANIGLPDIITNFTAFTNAAPFCKNCKQNLMQFACSLQYPQCTAGCQSNFCTGPPAAPSNGYCTAAISSCAPNGPGVPATLRNQIVGSLLAQFAAQGFDCGNLPYYGSTSSIDYTSQLNYTDTNCPCVPAGLTGMCAPYVTYNVSGLIATVGGVIEAGVSAAISAFSSIQSFTCNDCYNGLIAASCYAAFPNCNSGQPLVPPCGVDCLAQLKPCNLTSLTYAFLPACGGATQGCWSPPPAANTTTCKYCAKRTDLTNCGPAIVNYETFLATIPGFDIAQFDLFLGQTAVAQNVPGCPQCTTALRQLYCSTYVLPCSNDIINGLIAGMLQANVTGNTTLPLDQLLKLIPRPCFSNCQRVVGNCTLPGTTATIDCNFGTNNLPLFSKDENCFSQSWGPLPPSNCTGFFPSTAPPTPAPTTQTPNTSATMVVSFCMLLMILLAVL